MGRKLTIKDRIDRFVKKHKEPQQPGIVFGWTRKDGLHEAHFGEAGGANIYVNVGTKVIAQHYCYDEKLGLIELAYITIDNKTPKKDEDRRWKYLYRYFIPKDTRDLYDIDGNTGKYHVVRSSYELDVIHPYDFARHFSCAHRIKSQFENNFLPFAGNHTQLSSKCYWMSRIENPWQLEYWFKYKPKNKTNGKVQKTLDKLTSAPLKSIEELFQIKELCKKFAKDTYCRRVAYMDLEHKVLRCFYIGMDGDIAEERRVYFCGGKVCATSINDLGEWVADAVTSGRFGHIIVNIDAIYALPHCEYLKQLVDDDRRPFRIRRSVYDVVSAMKCADIEQLCNMGMYNIAKYIYRSSYKNASMKQIFGVPTKSNGVLRKYQITKRQLECVNGDDRIYGGTVARMKKLLGTNEISSIGYDLFVKYYDAIANHINDDWRLNRIFCSAEENKTKTVFLRLVNWLQSHADAVRTFSDAVYTYNNISANNRPAQSPYDVKSYEEMLRLHDTCVRINNIEQEERNRLYAMREKERNAELQKKMEKLNKERVKLNYEDGDFIIRIPKTLVEIANEGAVLRHCVGGYTQSHAMGNTTILFLRKKSAPDTPFYTIELGTNNYIVQIHGFGNKWLGNDADAIPTVMRWLRLHNINCSDQILLSTSKSYGCCGAPMVAKPKI